jgi:PKD repeat protein
MKKKLHSLFLKATLMISATLIIGSAFSQTVYNDYQDGKIWFKLKDNQILHQPVLKDSKTTIDLNNLKLSIMPYLRKAFTSHSVTRLAQPFPKAYGSNALLKTYLIEFNDINSVDIFIRELEESGAVEYAEKVPLDKIDLTPNDPYYNSSQMWGLFQVNAGNAWNVGTGSASIIVATTDNAIEIAHPDLTNQIWTNSGEIAGNGIDDDGNGYVDDVNGYDVGDNDNDPSPPNSGFDHGTHVAGTTGAESNNGIGVASIGYGITIMPVKSTRDNAGSNSITNGYDGIYYATVSGADVINCSWGGTGFSTTGQNIVNFAWNNGSIVVAAAGNDGTDNDVTPHYPSNYTNAIAVASSTSGDVKSSFSNYGTNSVDITAPGSNIASTVPYGNYGYMSGTSMASPMVSGLLGLMKSLNPTMPNQDLINCMYSTADNIDGANPSYVGKLGAGRINAFAAMNCVGATLNNPPTANFSANFTTVSAGGTISFTDLSTFGPTTWSWNFDNQALGGVTPATANTQGPHSVTYANPGVYEVSLTVTNANGGDTETKTGYITVTALGACVNLNLDDPTFATLSSIHVGWTPTLYTAGAGNGYVAGTNIYGDKAKVEYFPAAMVGSLQYVTGAYVWFGKAYASNPNNTIDLNVYDATGGTPGAILATRSITMSTIGNGSIRYYEFNPPVAVPASAEIAVGIDYSNLNWSTDTLAIVTNVDGEASNSTGFEKLTGNTWNDYATRWSGLTISHYIFPELTNAPATINLSASPTTICEGDIVNFDATGSTYQDTLLWSFPGTTPNTSNNVTEAIIYNTAGTYKAYLQVVGGGCSNYRIDSVTITVNPTPTPTITATNDTICNGSSVTLTGSGATSYLWTPGGLTTPSILVSPTTTTTYNLAGTTTGCTGNGSKTIYVENPPTATATHTPSGTVCANTGINFDGTGSSGAGSYSWSFPQGSPSSSSSTSPFPIISFGTGGTHNYSLQVTNTCGSNTFNSTITVNTVDVSTTLAAGSITANATSATYQWVDCNNSYAYISGETGQVYNPTASGDYAVIVTQNGCTDTSACVNYLITGVNELSNNTIRIYPNPVNDKVTISLGNTSANEVTLSDAQGKLIYSSVVNGNELVIDLTAVSKGVYFLQVLGDDDIKTYKVIKQ